MVRLKYQLASRSDKVQPGQIKGLLALNSQFGNKLRQNGHLSAGRFISENRLRFLVDKYLEYLEKTETNDLRLRLP